MKIQTQLIGAALLGMMISACGAKPTAEQCDKFVDKMVNIAIEEAKKENPTGSAEGDALAGEMAKAAAEGMKPEFKKQCMEEATKAEIECALKQKSMADIEKNC